ncbi:CHAD domain-containing protein [Streptomyces sp. NPDC059037]|uniref:CHAD domain-containing protein n=1 Tax=Streptomyces sp. NPDC059037 TaxID=3346710 RepID=UPI0036B090CC
MAQQHLDESTAGEVLAAHLRAQATEFLRSLRLHRESTTDAQGAEESLEAARALRRAARRIGGTLHTFRPLLDQEWATDLRPELAWLSGTLAREHAYATRLERLLDALHRLSGAPGVPSPAEADVTSVGRRSARRNGWAQPSPQGADEQGGAPRGLTVGAAKAAALLERQLTLARTRAHSTALQAFGSSRFHAVADNVAVLASEVPLSASREALEPLAAKAESNLAEAVAALPLGQAGHPYNAEALVHGLAAEAANEAQDAPWLKARALLRLHRYAQEVLRAGGDDFRLTDAGHALDRHREAADAASAAASAARTPRIAPATAYALGVLHADQRHEVEAARFDFHQAWLREAVHTP